MTRSAHRGAIFHLLADPASGADAWRYHPDGLLVVEDGHIAAVGDYVALAPSLGDLPVVDHRPGLLVPGFVDCHIHFPQVDVVASYGAQLLDWLEQYTFPAEARFADLDHAAAAAEFFLGQLLANGTTSALVFSSVHKPATEALFRAAERLDMRLIAGKVMMDRNAPPELCDGGDHGYGDCAALIGDWHGKGRLGYAVTPRFAITSTEGQLQAAGRLLAEHPGLWLQTHLAENPSEIAEVKRLFPNDRDYLGVYERFGLVGARSVFAHCVHLDDDGWARLKAANAAVAFCPTSNLFLGSGLFDLAAAAGHRVGLGSDIGAGTSFSMLATLNEAYKIGQLRGVALDALAGFYLATLGGASALGLSDKIGNFEPGKEADFLILDLGATPLLARRTGVARGIEEVLFALMMLGDDRAVRQTHVAGRLVHQRQRG